MTDHATIQKTAGDLAKAMKHGAVRAHHSVPEPIRRVAALLNKNSAKENDDGRKHERHTVIVPCRLNIDTEGLGALHGHDAFMHNIARGGIGLLIDEPRTRDDMIEVRIEINGTMSFLCGVVVFCRHIEGNVHEVGVQLHQRSEKPLLASLFAAPDKDNPEWFVAARTKLCESRGEKKSK